MPGQIGPTGLAGDKGEKGIVGVPGFIGKTGESGDDVSKLAGTNHDVTWCNALIHLYACCIRERKV